jgi:hypothetical protein
MYLERHWSDSSRAGTSYGLRNDQLGSDIMRWKAHGDGGDRGGGTDGTRRAAEAVVVAMKLKVRVVRYGCPGRERWYADIDDADDRQPDDPYWYVAGCGTQREALSAACAHLAELSSAGRMLERISYRAAA